MKAERTIDIDPGSLLGFKMLFILPPFPKEHKMAPPNGIGYLAGMLEANGARCWFIDGIKDRLTVEDILARASALKPDLVGIPLLTPMYKTSKALILELARAGFRTVAGGPHASALPAETLAETGAD